MANLIFALFNPSDYKLNDDGGYDINRLGPFYRSLEILRNRDGDSNVIIGLFYYAKIGSYVELPKPSDSVLMEKVYNKITELKM